MYICISKHSSSKDLIISLSDGVLKIDPSALNGKKGMI